MYTGSVVEGVGELHACMSHIYRECARRCTFINAAPDLTAKNPPWQ